MAKPGPKPMKVTPRQKQQVRFWAAAGISRETIARMMHMNLRTLLEHFAVELASVAEMEIATNLDRLRRAADAGNVTAMRVLQTKLEYVAAYDSFKTPEIETVPVKDTRGKKEIRLEEAKNAGNGTDWGDDLDSVVARTVN